MRKPIILIDFDGVFNILGTYDDALKLWNNDVTRVTIPYDGHPTEKEFTVKVANPLIDFFVRLAASDLVEIIWLTTWVDNTAKFPEWLGLPEFPYLERPDVDSEWEWWKLKAAKAFVEEVGSETPILWIDDDHGYDSSAVHWLFTSQQQIHPLAPSSVEALVPLEVDLITFFVEKHTGVEIAINRG